MTDAIFLWLQNRYLVLLHNSTLELLQIYFNAWWYTYICICLTYISNSRWNNKCLTDDYCWCMKHSCISQSPWLDIWIINLLLPINMYVNLTILKWRLKQASSSYLYLLCILHYFKSWVDVKWYNNDFIYYVC